MKIKLSSVLDLSKFLTTSAGKELRDVLEYLSQLSQQLISALTSNLSYADNFSCEIKNIQVKSNTFTVINPGRSVNVTEVRVRRVYDNRFYILNYSGWNYNDNGNINFIANFTSTPIVFYYPTFAAAIDNSGVITVVDPNHGLKTGYTVMFYNAAGFTTSNNANGTTTITVTSGNSFTYTAPGGDPAGGPGTLTYKVIDDLSVYGPPSDYLINLDIIIYYG